MEPILSQWWNNASMLSEFTSALSLVIFVALTNFFLRKRTNNKLIKFAILPFFYGFDGMFAIFIGLGFGRLIEPGCETALLSVPFTLVKAIYFNTYNLVIAAICIQTIGSITGVLIYLMIVKTFFKSTINQTEIVEGLILPDETSMTFGAKETIAQISFMLMLVFLSAADFGFSPRGNVYFGIFIISILLTFQFLVLTRWHYFTLSPQLVLSNIILGYFLKAIDKVTLKSFGMGFIIQISATCLVAYPEHILRA